MKPNDQGPHSPGAPAGNRGPQDTQPAEAALDGDGFTRRDFLKVSGFSMAAAMLPGCERPPAAPLMPYLEQPEGIVAGRATWYATTCAGCSAACGALAKVRDGRPIKLEGNPGHPVSAGGLCAAGQGQILPLYDTQRLAQPAKQGQPTTWDKVDAEVKAALASVKQAGGLVRVLTGTVHSPTTKAAIAAFCAEHPGASHVSYDALSVSAILDAHKRTHGARLLPSYDFAAAREILSLDADFLGTWISPVQHTAGWRAGRTLEDSPPRLSRHIQVETRMSLTGSNADERLAIAPAELGPLVSGVANALAHEAKVKAPVPAPTLEPERQRWVTARAHALWAARGSSLVVCGANQLETQVLVNWINHTLGNYEKTLSLKASSYQSTGDDAALAALLAELQAGKVGALFVAGVNPVFDLPGGAKLAEALKKVKLVVSFAERIDETAAVAHYVCPEHHPLEAWGDGEPIAGRLTVTQPTIRPLRSTRALIESLAAWRGAPKPAHAQIREHWQSTLFGLQREYGTFGAFWDHALHDGHARINRPAPTVRAFDAAAVKPIPAAPMLTDGRLALVLYPKVGMLAGQHGHNPWLHELPDPVSKMVWDNYAALSPEIAKNLGLRDGDFVEVGAGDVKLTLPAMVQQGQHHHAVAIALGYGRAGTDRFTNVGPSWIEAELTVEAGGTVGVNAAPLLSLAGGQLGYTGTAVTVSAASGRRRLACTQDHHSLTVPAGLGPQEPRPFVQETTLDAYMLSAAAGAPAGHHPTSNMWAADHEYKGHHWGMMIDLAACTGCSACVLACQAENNIPVVGRDEVRRSREMSWLRIDRYYAESDTGTDVVHQPMMCQQCDHAPCETVCPVLATVHSSEGLNQQVYNRCVGTRYCSNNCPYKARRFNWFDYAREDQLQNMQLNPDITIRTRGVMEKCTFCVQRIQEGKTEAATRGEPLVDGAIQTACQQSCPAKAITFGDVNDKGSAASLLRADPRTFRVLDDLGVEPSVGYMRIVRNRAAQHAPSSGGKH